MENTEQAKEQKRELKKDILRVIKKRLEFETIGLKDGEQVKESDIINVLSEVLSVYGKKPFTNLDQHDPKVDKYGKELSEPVDCGECDGINEPIHKECGNCYGTDYTIIYNQAPTRSEFIKSLLEKQESDKEKLDKAYTSHSNLYELNEGLHDKVGELQKKVKELEADKALLLVDHDKRMEETIEYFEMEEQLTQAKKEIDELREVLSRPCKFYVSGTDTAMNCINCGNPKWTH